MGLYLRPSTLADALAALADPKFNAQSAKEDRVTVLAGGTDVFPALAARRGWLEPHARNILDIWNLDELRGIRHDQSGTSIGALTSWSEIGEAALSPPFDGLKLAAREVGGRQVQNRGTIAGNICNASPAADGVPPLLALDARVEIASVRGRRSMPLGEFITGNRATALASDELVVSIRMPRQPAGARSNFLKLGARTYLLISIASVATLVTLDAEARISQVAIAVGACSAVPVRLSELERRLVGATAETIAQCVTRQGTASGLAPIDDVRGSADYRSHAALVLIRRALMQCFRDSTRAAA
jgi:CO/xanthine dehydrogenase FAD-binding subunit